jgi:hypothetical protein
VGSSTVIAVFALGSRPRDARGSMPGRQIAGCRCSVAEASCHLRVQPPLDRGAAGVARKAGRGTVPGSPILTQGLQDTPEVPETLDDAADEQVHRPVDKRAVGHFAHPVAGALASRPFDVRIQGLPEDGSSTLRGDTSLSPDDHYQSHLNSVHDHRGGAL